MFPHFVCNAVGVIFGIRLVAAKIGDNVFQRLTDLIPPNNANSLAKSDQLVGSDNQRKIDPAKVCI